MLGWAPWLSAMKIFVAMTFACVLMCPVVCRAQGSLVPEPADEAGVNVVVQPAGPPPAPLPHIRPISMCTTTSAAIPPRMRSSSPGR